MITTQKKQIVEQTTQPAIQQQTGQQQAAQRPTQGYTGLTGVSNETAQQLGQAQKEYTPNTVTQATQQQLQQLQQNKPQAYSSMYTDQLNGILQEIQGNGQKPFTYEFNKDNLFLSLKEMYEEQAKQAATHTQGNAAAQTGGYGNSYGQTAAAQVYQQALLPMYDKGIQLAQMAYDRDRDQQADRYNRLQALMNLDEQAYGRNRDALADYKDERDYLTARADAEDEKGYNRYMNERDYLTKLAQIENADYNSELERQEAIRQFQLKYEEEQRQFNENLSEGQRQFDASLAEQQRQADLDEAYRQQQLAENIRQFDASLEWDKMSTEQKYYADWVEQILAMGQMPSDELLQAAGLSAEDAQKLMAQLTTGGGGGSTKQTTKDESYIDAAARVLRNTPGNTTVGELNGSGDTRTLDDMKANVVLDVGRPGGSLAMTPQAWSDIRSGKVQTKNSAKEFAENLRDQHDAAAKAKTPLKGAEQQSYDDYLKKKLGIR